MSVRQVWNAKHPLPKSSPSSQKDSPPLPPRVYLQSSSPPSYNPLRDQMINQLHNISTILDSHTNLSNAYIHAPPSPPPQQIHPSSHAQVNGEKLLQLALTKKGKGRTSIYKQIQERMDYLRTTEAELGIDLDRPLSEQDPLDRLNDLANKKRKHADYIHDFSRANKRLKSSVQYKDHPTGNVLNEPVLVSSASALQVLKRLGSIFTSVYAAVKMEDPNITMEEYIKLEKEKARRHGKVYNWEIATYGKIWNDEDVHDLRSVETEFLAIVINDTLTSEVVLSCEPTVSPITPRQGRSTRSNFMDIITTQWCQQ
ncbi:hypothetical protein Tco_0013543 [Tanacetum coccineum]